MLDGLLGRGFASKCKSLIKLTKARIDVIRRKRNATQKFLKKDVADLLANGLDINAFGRAEGLLVDLILSTCYDFVDHCCDLVLKNLSAMQKQSECPEECRTAVASLMFAAARFSDLPELRDLRQMFLERYGNSIDMCRNEEFVQNLASKPSTLENKVRLMKEIALEFSIKWDSKAFEQRMNKPSMYPLDPPKAHEPFLIRDDKSNSSNVKDKVRKADKHGILLQERFDLNDDHKLRNGKDDSCNVWEETIMKKENHDNLHQGGREFGPDRRTVLNMKEDATPKTVRLGSSSQRKRVESVDAGKKLHDARGNNIPIFDSEDTLPYPKPDMGSPHVKSNGKEKFADDNFGGQHVTANSASKDEAITNSKPYYNNALPPPYVKRNVKSKSRKHAAHLGSSDDGFDGNGVPTDSSTYDRANASGPMSEGVQRGSDHSDYERHHAGPERVNHHHHEKDHTYPNDLAGNPIPKPRSSRRRHSKSQSYQSDTSNVEEAEVLPRKSRSKRREDSRRGLQILFDDEHHRKDEEERIIDKLLIHYSKKPSAYEPGKLRRKSRSRHAHHGESPGDGSRGGSDKESQVTPPPARSVSLPHEHTHTGTSSTTKVFTRAATFQAERSDAARHVHPKLPDYDDLAAQFAALRGR